MSSLYSAVKVILQRLKPQPDSEAGEGRQNTTASLHVSKEQMAHVAVIWMESPGLSFSCRLFPCVS